jgi:glucose/arabinose dehydrogenase
MRRLTVMLALVALLASACGGSGNESSDQQTPGTSSQAASPTGQPAAADLPPLAPTRVQVPAGMGAAPFNTARTLNIPTGWTASVVARIDKARFMTLTPNGELLVSQPSTGAVQLVRGGQVSQFVSGLNRPHDMVFAEVGGQTSLFIAEAHRVMRYPYTKGDVGAQQGQVAVDGLPDTSTPELRGQYAHVLKNIAVHEGKLYVSIASTCNACVEDTRSDPQRAAIYTYDAAGRNANRKLFATGLRNAEGLAFVPGTADLWVVVNNRDNTLVPDDRDVDGDGRSDKGKRVTRFVDDYPLEPFTSVKEGGFYGWPFCNPNSDNGPRNMPYHRDYELNRDGQRADCGKATPIDIGLQAHTAPLGLTFTQGTKAPNIGAVIPMHGSWNRSTPSGYKVVYFPWTANGPGEQRELATGWLVGGRSWGRPVDVAIDTDGALLVSDDAAGAVIKLAPPTR